MANRRVLAALGFVAMLCLAICSGPLLGGPSEDSGPLRIGSRLELFVDDWLIERTDGVTKKLHSPTRQNAAIVVDKPWESPHIAYVTVLEDVADSAEGAKKLYRMYYRSMSTKKDGTPSYTGYAESKDGITWEKPELGIINCKGSSKNNLVFDEQQTTNPHGGNNLCPFKDTNPAATESGRYKALIPFRVPGVGSPLMAVASPDALRWTRMQEEAVDENWEYESEKTNYTFWDTNLKRYVVYIRSWADEGFLKGMRHVARIESEDFVNWTNMQLLDFGDAPKEHIYTFGPQQYFRAPHIYMALSMRYLPPAKGPQGGQLAFKEGKLIGQGRNWAQGASRETWVGFYEPEHGVSDCVLSVGRDGLHWNRYMQAFIRPGRDGQNWTDRNMIPARGIIQTAPDEMSVYWVEHYLHPTARVQRGTLRLDGFVSIHATYPAGELLTRPLIFKGSELVINYASSAAGGLRVEIQDENGSAIPGFTLNESADIYGDEIERVVAWRNGSDVGSLAGKPVRLRFVMQDADLYSIQFRP
jgi:hypothetical protein